VARTRASRNRTWMLVILIVAAAGGAWWWRSTWASRQSPHPIASPDVSAPPIRQQAPAKTADEPAGGTSSAVPPAPGPEPIPLSAEGLTPNTASKRPAPPAAGSLAQAAAALEAGDYLSARRLYNAAVDPEAPAATFQRVTGALARIADETLFSSKVVRNDPLTGFHVVEKGETLLKIAKKYKVTPQLLAKINQLRNPNLIRYKQRLKIIRGPFHVVVYKHNFRMLVYCQDTLVRAFPVALGAEGTTPTGLWRVKVKLMNPTYYPPRGGKIIQADDPENPLGERWIGLEGLEGEAKGQERYGIHGTIEPDSIGKNVSLGCIRMHNPDVEFLFDLLTEGHSQVTVKD